MTKREKELIQQGWQRRFVAAEPRLSEMGAIYEETGFEVHLEPLSAVEAPDKDSPQGWCEKCMICFQGSEDRYQVIYTRPKRRSKGRREKGDRRTEGLK
jgi:hypothetical protein